MGNVLRSKRTLSKTECDAYVGKRLVYSQSPEKPRDGLEYVHISEFTPFYTRSVRVIGPDDMVTMEMLFGNQRLNIYIEWNEHDAIIQEINYG